MKQQSKETEDFVYFDFILHNNVHSLDRYNACHIEFKLVSFVKGLSILQWRAYPHFYQDITTIQTQVSWSDYRNFNSSSSSTKTQWVVQGFSKRLCLCIAHVSGLCIAGRAKSFWRLCPNWAKMEQCGVSSLVVVCGWVAKTTPRLQL